MTTPTLADVQAAIAAVDRGGIAGNYASSLAIEYCRAAGWRPVESSLPENEVHVLVCDGGTALMAQRWFSTFWIEDASGTQLRHVTHWQPLPAPPRQPTADAGGLTHPPQGER